MSTDTVLRLANHSGGVLYVIAALLFVALTVIIERSWYLHRVARATRAALDAIDAESASGAPSVAALSSWASRDHGMPSAELFETASRLVGATEREAVSMRLEEVVMRKAPQIDRFFWVLDTIVTLAPLLGLFGTIVGMFNAFQVLSNPGNAPTQVTGGVAEALIATASGLFVAMLGLVFFNGLNNRLRVVMHQLDTLKTVLANRLTDAARDEARDGAKLERTAPHVVVKSFSQHGA
jgi:biopolymer transport protein ExbB